GERGPVRGLARLLRRNPTDAERLLWAAFTNDRRFAGKGIKRQVPVGTHITDFVAFPLRLVIELVPAQGGATAAEARAERPGGGGRRGRGQGGWRAGGGAERAWLSGARRRRGRGRGRSAAGARPLGAGDCRRLERVARMSEAICGNSPPDFAALIRATATTALRPGHVAAGAISSSTLSAPPRHPPAGSPCRC